MGLGISSSLLGGLGAIPDVEGGLGILGKLGQLLHDNSGMLLDPQFAKAGLLLRAGQPAEKVLSNCLARVPAFALAGAAQASRGGAQ